MKNCLIRMALSLGATPGVWLDHREPSRQEGHINFTLVTLPITGSSWIVIRISKRAVIKCLHWLLLGHPHP